MRKFTAICIDNVTKMQIMFSECGFNEVCMQLETMNTDGKFGEYKGMEYCSRNVSKFVFEKCSFYYDEERALLLYKGKK